MLVNKSPVVTMKGLTFIEQFLWLIVFILERYHHFGCILWLSDYVAALQFLT